MYLSSPFGLPDAHGYTLRDCPPGLPKKLCFEIRITALVQMFKIEFEIQIEVGQETLTLKPVTLKLLSRKCPL